MTLEHFSLGGKSNRRLSQILWRDSETAAGPAPKKRQVVHEIE